jgi:endonuclease/exonuclease/phosphatase family metal-dependent hydrolase
MAKDSERNAQVQQLLAVFMQLPWKVKIGVVVLLVVAGGVWFYLSTRAAPQAHQAPPPPADDPSGARTVVLCHWNMENLFDDKDDKRRHPDAEYDSWFAHDAEARTLKYQHLSEALVKLNGGRGPDVVVGNEIETPRAAELLQEALNARLPEGVAKYEYVAMKDLDAGRHIAPCVISRYPLSGAKLRGRRQRILEVHVTVNNHDLYLVAAHWTSQLTDKGDHEDGGRAKYATTIYEMFTDAMRENPRVDFIVCGDFNDTPDSDPVVNKLHVTTDVRLVTIDANPPRLFGLLSGKDPAAYGTHYYNKPLIYDHIAVSPGLLDDIGWSYVADSVQVPTEGLTRAEAKRRPWRFGNEHDKAISRGYSDHFPVVATFKVAP